eukprot:5945395-Prymnesium_polylepis.1
MARLPELADVVMASGTPRTETIACAKPFFSSAGEELAGTFEESIPVICSRSCSCSASAAPVSGGGAGGSGGLVCVSERR